MYRNLFIREFVDFALGNKKKAEYITRLTKKRTDLSKEEINEIIEIINGFNNQRKEMAAVYWICNKTMSLPDDAWKLDNAVELMDRFNLDYLKFSSPDKLIKSVPPEKRARVISSGGDPDLYKELKLDYKTDTPVGELSVYHVQDDREGQMAVRNIMNAQRGKNWEGPWCLLHGDGEGGVSKRAWEFWSGRYTATPKRVAFLNGDLLAFCASEEYYDCDNYYDDDDESECEKCGIDTWWDLNNCDTQETIALPQLEIQEGITLEDFVNIYDLKTNLTGGSDVLRDKIYNAVAKKVKLEYDFYASFAFHEGDMSFFQGDGNNTGVATFINGNTVVSADIHGTELTINDIQTEDKNGFVYKLTFESIQTVYPFEIMPPDWFNKNRTAPKMEVFKNGAQIIFDESDRKCKHTYVYPLINGKLEIGEVVNSSYIKDIDAENIVVDWIKLLLNKRKFIEVYFVLDDKDISVDMLPNGEIVSMGVSDKTGSRPRRSVMYSDVKYYLDKNSKWDKDNSLVVHIPEEDLEIIELYKEKAVEVFEYAYNDAMAQKDKFPGNCLSVEDVINIL